MMPGSQEHSDPLNQQEKIAQPEKPDTIKDAHIESESEIEELAQERSNNLEIEATNLESDGTKRIENANNSIGLAPEKIEEAKATFGLQEKLGGVYEKGKALAQEGKEKIGQVVTTKEFNQIADATPFIGGAKKVVESVAGKTLSGEELKGMERVKHGVKGGIDLGLDIAAVGEVEKGARLAYAGKKIAEGVKQNPEAVANLGKKILSQKENKEIETKEKSETGQEKIDESKLEKETGEKNFVSNIEVLMSEKDYEETIDKYIAPGLAEKLSGFRSDQVEEFEKYYQEYESTQILNDKGKPPEYMLYWAQRSFLDKEDMLNIKKSIEAGNLKEYLKEAVSQERKQISETLEANQAETKLRNCADSIKDFFDENGVKITRDNLPNLQFIGKFDAMLLASANQKELVFGSMFDGGYVPTLDGLVIKLSPENIKNKEIKDEHLRAYIHENMHALSYRKIVADKELGIDDSEAKYLKGGFLSRNIEGRRRNSLNSLNEGATEYFSRAIAEKVGIPTVHEFGEEGYDNYVRDTEVLLKKIGGQKLSDEKITETSTKELLDDYCKPTGVLKLGKIAQEKIGPHALALFDILSGSGRDNNFYNFVESLENYQQGKEARKINIDKDELKNYPFREDELKKQYPFLEFTGDQIKNTTSKAKDMILEDSNENNLESPELVSEATKLKENLLSHIRSDEYLAKLKKELDGNEDEAKRYQKIRTENLENVKITPLSLGEMKERFGKDDPPGANVVGYYDPIGHEAFIAHDHKDKYVTAMHELIHASTRQEKDMSEKAKKILAESTKEGSVDYLRKPEERMARKQLLDLEMDKLGIKKYGEEFKVGHYEKLMEYFKEGKLSRPAKEFINTTKPEEFKKIFDELAKNEFVESVSNA
ncbi:MAG: hypothetical protein V1804_02270 [Patescibacteria group bacterium]